MGAFFIYLNPQLTGLEYEEPELIIHWKYYTTPLVLPSPFRTLSHLLNGKGQLMYVVPSYGLNYTATAGLRLQQTPYSQQANVGMKLF